MALTVHDFRSNNNSETTFLQGQVVQVLEDNGERAVVKSNVGPHPGLIQKNHLDFAYPEPLFFAIHSN